MFVIGIILYDKLPDQLPIHRNIQGQVDSYWEKPRSVFVLPLITIAMLVLFLFLPKIDPKKANYPKFTKTWEIIQFTIIGLMAYVYFVSLFVTIYPEYNINYFIMPWLGLLFVIAWNYMNKIKHNFFVWIKTPRTIASEEVWRKTHRLSGKLWTIVWVLLIIQTFVMKENYILFLIWIAALVPMIYSFLIFQKEEKKK